MSAQDRHDARDRASEPVQREPAPADPAAGGHEPAQPLSPVGGPFPPSASDALGYERERLEEALRESEERFRGLFEASPWGLLVHDDGRILDANSALAMIFGYEVSELIGMDAPLLVAPEWRDFTLQRRIAGCEEPYEAVCLRRDGSIFPVQLCGSAVRSNGRVVRMVAVRDLGEHRRLEEELRRREQEISVLADNVPALYSYVDAEGRYQFVNQRYEEWFGIPRERIIGRHYREVLGAAAYERIKSRVEKALLGQQVRFEEEVPYRSGGTRWVSADYVPDTDDGGKVQGFFALVTDITERKRAEEALRESEERFRRLCDASHTRG